MLDDVRGKRPWGKNRREAQERTLPRYDEEDNVELIFQAIPTRTTVGVNYIMIELRDM